MRRVLLSLLLALGLLPGTAGAVVNVGLAGATATTSTTASVGANGGPISTALRPVDVQVWGCATSSPCAGSPTYTVLLEERSGSLSGSSAPWQLVATFADCNSAGIGTVTPASTGTPASSVPCHYVANVPALQVRTRISARTNGTIWAHVVTQ